MLQWDEYGASRHYAADTRLSDDDAARGLIGVGLARILNLCAELKIADCPPPPAAKPAEPVATTAPAKEDFSDLAAGDVTQNNDPDAHLPRIDLLAATAGGAPNVVSLYVSGAESQGVKELDDNYIGMTSGAGAAAALRPRRAQGHRHRAAAQPQRGDGRGAGAAAGAVQGARPRSRGARLRRADAALHPDRSTSSRSIFVFIAVIMGVIVLFAVVNTMTMSVMERTNEIGTTRAMGVRRSGIRRQFLLEGCCWARSAPPSASCWR